MARGVAVLMAAVAFVTMPAKAATIFKEAGGVAVIEAEHFDARSANTDGHRWQVIPNEGAAGGTTPAFRNARGNAYVQSLPDSAGGGANYNGATDAIDRPPFIDYKVAITTPGDYAIYLRWTGYDGSSDSMYAQIVELNATSPQWYRFVRNTGTDFSTAVWDNNGAPDSANAGGGEVPAVWTIPTAGTYTIRLSMREDGSAVDAIALQLATQAAPTGEGPAESDLQEGFILGTPANATVVPPATATFTAVAKTGPGATVTYQWQSAPAGSTTFTDIAGATSASYTTGATTEAMSGTQYRVVATSGGTTLTSGAATLITDSTPPSVLHAFSGPANTQVTIQFSERLDTASAETIGNYPISGGVTVSAAKLGSDGRTVYLKTSTQTSGTSYTVTVNGVKDVPGNALTGGTATFKGPVDVPGQLIVRKYEGIGGTAVNDLLNNAKYPDQPASVTQWSTFGGVDIFPTTGDNLGSDFGLEITGFVIPTVTADYVFYISSDDASQLWLSTDETAANATLIARENGCCNQFTYAPGGLSSGVIPLEAGKRYYVRAYIKEGGGGDFLSVAWRNSVTDGDPTVAPTGQLEGIPTENLASGYDPSASVTITSQPANVTAPANAPYSFTVAYDAYSPVSGTSATVQWEKAPSGSTTFTPIAGATGNTYNVTFAKATDNGAQYRAVVTSAGVTATSNPATLTVSGSVPLITLTKTIEHRFFANQTVNNIAGLRANPNFPNNPTMITFEPLFEYGPNGSNEAGSNYGNRLAGWLKAPETGDYVFFTCADDPSELWLSTDEDPTNKRLVATETGWSNARQWTTSPGGSVVEFKRSDTFTNTQWPVKDATLGGAKITLEAGKHYYVEVLHTEGTGGDNVGVNWKTPTGAEPVDADPPISADFVDQLLAVTGTVTFGTQPANATTAANTTATFTAAATSADGKPLTFIWQSAPAGSTEFSSVGTGTSFTTPLLTTADDNRQYRVVAFGPSGAGVSTVATVDVTADSVPPTITYFTANRTQAQIVFSEPVDPTTGGALTSYAISGGAGASITAATVGTTPAGFGMVTLDLSGLNNLVDYTITIKDVKDTANNTIVQTTRTFKAYDIFADFNGPTPPPKTTFAGSAKVLPGSFDGSAMLQLTAASGNQQGTIGIDDVLGGDATNVTLQAKIFVGKGGPGAGGADGFSINIASDLAVTADPTTSVNVGEEGTGSGLTIAFDSYQNAGEPPASIDVKWAGAVVVKPDGTDATAVVTKATLINNQWADVFVQLKGDPVNGTATVTVVYNNVKYFDNLPVPGFTLISNPKVAIGGRTGGEFEEVDVDNLTVVYNTDVAPPQPPTISITAPTAGATLTAGADAPITVNASASAGVSKVEFYANGTLLGQSTTAPYSFTVPGAIVTPGFYTLTAKITDNAGVAVTSAPINVIVRPPASANADKVLYVHATAGPNAADNAVMNRLFVRGMDVYPIGAAASATTDADDKKLVVISSTVPSGDVNTKFTDVTAGVVNWENALEDDLLWTTNDGADRGVTGATETQVSITAAGAAHQMGAGLPAGPVTITTAAADLSFGKPGAAAVRIATQVSDPTRAIIYGYDTGALLIDGTTPAAGRRVNAGLTDSTFTQLNADGLKLFDAAIDWARGAGAVATPQITAATLSGGNINITWTNGGTLEWTSALLPNNATVWTSTNDSDGSYSEAVTTAQMKIFRVRK